MGYGNKSIEEWCEDVHDIAKSKGWHEPRPAQLDVKQAATWIALAHSELSEALEELRKAESYESLKLRIEDGKPEGFIVEMADAVIRIMDTCQALGLNLEDAIRQKTYYNASRPHRHGNKRV